MTVVAKCGLTALQADALAVLRAGEWMTTPMIAAALGRKRGDYNTNGILNGLYVRRLVVREETATGATNVRTWRWRLVEAQP